MIELTTIERDGTHRYRVVLRLERTVVYTGEFSESDINPVMVQVKRHALMLMGLTKGKTMTSGKAQ